MSKQVRQALAALCISLALLVAGLAAGGSPGQLLLFLGSAGAVLSLVMLAVELVRKPDHVDR